MSEQKPKVLWLQIISRNEHAIPTCVFPTKLMPNINNIDVNIFLSLISKSMCHTHYEQRNIIYSMKTDIDQRNVQYG